MPLPSDPSPFLTVFPVKMQETGGTDKIIFPVPFRRVFLPPCEVGGSLMKLQTSATLLITCQNICYVLTFKVGYFKRRRLAGHALKHNLAQFIEHIIERPAE